MFTPLMALCFVTTKSESQATCARALIDAGARINAHDRYYFSLPGLHVWGRQPFRIGSHTHQVFPKVDER